MAHPFSKQAKAWNTAQCGWPKKAAEFLLGLLQNAQANAEKKSLDLDALQITHIQVNQAPTRLTARNAHGDSQSITSNSASPDPSPRSISPEHVP